jgi:hypothetical protein
MISCPPANAGPIKGENRGSSVPFSPLAPQLAFLTVPVRVWAVLKSQNVFINQQIMLSLVIVSQDLPTGITTLNIIFDGTADAVLSR